MFLLQEIPSRFECVEREFTVKDLHLWASDLLSEQLVQASVYIVGSHVGSQKRGLTAPQALRKKRHRPDLRAGTWVHSHLECGRGPDEGGAELLAAQ